MNIKVIIQNDSIVLQVRAIRELFDIPHQVVMVPVKAAQSLWEAREATNTTQWMKAYLDLRKVNGTATTETRSET